MTNYIFATILAFSIFGHAHEQSKNCADQFNFTAPLVYDVTTATPAEVGQIAYDTQDDEFKGYKNDGSWTSLSRPAAFLNQTSDVRAGAIAGAYLSMVNNSVTLTPGSWVLNGSVLYTLNGSSPNYSQIGGYWKQANGNDTSTAPPNLALEAGHHGYDRLVSGSQVVEYRLLMPAARITVSQDTPIYLVPNAWGVGNPGNARISTYIYAERVQ